MRGVWVVLLWDSYLMSWEVERVYGIKRGAEKYVQKLNKTDRIPDLSYSKIVFRRVCWSDGQRF